MIEKYLRLTATEYSEELIQYHLSEIQQMKEETKKELLEALKKQYEENKEYYDKKILNNNK